VHILNRWATNGCRGFAADEDIAGRDAVAIIGNGLWQQFFGSDPQVLGANIRVNGIPLTVIGVAPQGFDCPGEAALWTPTVFDRDLFSKQFIDKKAPTAKNVVLSADFGRFKAV
jgi:hypothetical protein